ncbi:MAG: hypothetical protein HY892_13385, partial [Deltaproteobacteria bacterium]|nr:hypothetical protein [Deltaproteobacteria bacterium]
MFKKRWGAGGRSRGRSSILAVLLVLAVGMAGCGKTPKTNGGPAPVKAIGPPPLTFGDKFYDVAAPDHEHIWVVGYFGAITHSRDGGRTWARQQAGTVQALTGVSFANNREGWIVGDQGTILHTRDGGAHWEKQKSPVVDQKLLKVQFLDEKNGFAVGTYGVILRTADGGSTWEKSL